MGVTDQQGTLATGRAKVCWGWPVAITAGLISQSTELWSTVCGTFCIAAVALYTLRSLSNLYGTHLCT